MISGLAIDSRENANSIDPSSSHLGKLGVGSLKFSQLKATTSVSTLFIWQALPIPTTFGHFKTVIKFLEVTVYCLSGPQHQTWCRVCSKLGCLRFLDIGDGEHQFVSKSLNLFRYKFCALVTSQRQQWIRCGTLWANCAEGSSRNVSLSAMLCLPRVLVTRYHVVMETVNWLLLSSLMDSLLDHD